MRIGFVGAGRMGLPMLRRLRAAGHDVRVLVRSAQRREGLAAEGFPTAERVQDVAAPVVIVCVFDDAQLRELCLDGPLSSGLPAAATLIVHTTASPRTVAAIAERTSDRGIEVLDAPVSGGPHDIAAGRITLFVGGSGQALRRVRPVLAGYADPVLHVGPLGAGERVKLLNNAVFAANLGVLREAGRLAAAWDLSESVLVDALTHGSAMSSTLRGVARRGSIADFTSAVGDFLAKDIAVVREIVTEGGDDLGVLAELMDQTRFDDPDPRGDR